MKKILAILLSLAMLAVLVAACAEKPEDVSLRLWGGETPGNQEMLREMADAFIELYKDEANITIEVGIVGESTARDTILTDPQSAADVFAIADDQLMSLYSAGALQEITIDPDRIKADNVAAAVDLATIDGKLYAYPMTADNGYMMYYDKSYFTEDDVKSLDRMMEVAAAAGKKITMPMANGWYGITFMRGVGLDTWRTDDGKAACTFNEEGGVAVLQAMLDIAANPGFINLGDDQFLTVIGDGSVIAGVNGPWNSAEVGKVWGDNYGACKLPTFTCDGKQVQMSGVLGCKLVGVNSYSENVGWAMRLADFITNKDNQIKRFEVLDQGPSNIAAADSDAVRAVPALVAISAQGEFSYPMSTGDNYWGPAGSLFEIMAQGNPDGTDLQQLLDEAVAGITS